MPWSDIIKCFEQRMIFLVISLMTDLLRFHVVPPFIASEQKQS